MAILQNTTVSGSLVVTGDLTARQFILSSSVTFYTESFASGSTRFGDSVDDVMRITGSLMISSSLGVSLFVTASTGQVGIGNSSPQSQLVVGKSGNNATLEFNMNNTGYSRIFSYDRTAVGSTNLILQDPGGNVGIGTTNPSTKLNILVDGVGAEDGILLGVGSQGDGIKIVQRYLSNRVVVTLGQSNYSGATDSGALRLYDVSGTETIRLSGKINVASFLNSSGGNVGIGTTSPANKLHVESASGDGSYLTTFQTTTGAADTGPSVFFGFHDGTTARDAGNIRNLKENGTSGNYSTYMSFATRTNGSTAAERMRINASGYLKIAPNGSYINPTAGFHELHGTAQSSDILYTRHTQTDPYGIEMIWSGASPNNTSNWWLYCADTTNAKAVIYSNGTFGSRTGTYGSIISDEKYKTEIEPAKSQWDDIKNLRVVNFKFKQDVELEGENALRQIGFIAQEVEQVSPNLVYESTDRDSGETWKSVKTSIIEIKAIKALQEAMAKIEQLEAKVTALENK
jgi:hypothetical protein